ncbi:amino acid permease [Nocardia australiensis]|uniref:amino acid permease n=1 Tax=Nocardia australiensis TaxID=2887191 RepID=UPI0027E0C2B4|nr:amino acid permease [Nocardia australiensis]
MTTKVAPKATGTNYISWVTLALMTTSSVASLRSAELASGWEGGVYRWVGDGLSKPLGFLAVWCQFAMTIFYYPILLAYVASTFAYIINPSLAANGVYVAIVIITVYWAGVYISAQGTKTVAGLSAMGLIVGTLIPGTMLVLLGFLFLAQGNPSAAPMDAGHLLPAWTGLASLVLIVVGVIAFEGIHNDAEASTRAEQLHDRLVDAGIPAPQPRVIADTLGRDGGLVCQDPSLPLIKARYQASVSNGASGPGNRPIIGDRDVATAVELAIATYCPDRLGEYLDQVQDMKFDNTTK